VPGDPIIGYITRGRGVSVHRTDCPNVKGNDETERRIEVSWSDTPEGSYQVEIEVEAIDRMNLLTNIMNTVSETRTNIASVNARTTKNRTANVSLVVDIKDVPHMESVMNRIRKVNGVLSVHRATPT
jgi:GTP pyrophosphokinase